MAVKPLLARLGARLIMTAVRGGQAQAPSIIRSDLETEPLSNKVRSDLRRTTFEASAGRATPVRLMSLGSQGEGLRRALSTVSAPDALLVPRFDGRGRSVSLIAGQALALPHRTSFIFAQILIESMVEARERVENRRRRDVRLLTQRQRDCLDAALRGANSIQIGAELELSPRTVDAYIAAAAQRLGAANRVAAVGLAVQLGLIGNA